MLLKYDIFIKPNFIICFDLMKILVISSILNFHWLFRMKQAVNFNRIINYFYNYTNKSENNIICNKTDKYWRC